MSTSQFAPLIPGETVAPAGIVRTISTHDTGRIGGNMAVLTAGIATWQEQSDHHLSTIGMHLHEMRDHLKTLADGSTQLNTALGVKTGEPPAAPTFNFTIDQKSIDGLVTCLAEALHRKFAEQSAATAAVGKHVDDLGAQVTRASAEQSAATAAVGKRVDDLGTQVTKASAEQSAATVAVGKRVDDLGGQVTEAQRGVSVAQSMVVGEESRLAVLLRRVDALAGQAQRLEGRQSGDEIIGDITALATQEQLGALTAVVGRLEEQLGRLLTQGIEHPTGPRDAPAPDPTPSPPNRPRGGGSGSRG